MEIPGLRETPAAAQETHHPEKGLWIGLFATGLGFCLLSIWLFDEPIAQFFARHWRQYPLHGLRIDAPVMVALIAAVLLVLGIFQLRGRTAKKSGATLTIAAYSALGGFAVNSYLLKPFFSRSRALTALSTGNGFFHAVPYADYSFPSGHSVIVAAILVTLWRYYPRWYPLYVAAMAVVTFLLLAGGWHFLSDIIAGSLWGALAAYVTARLWRKHAGASRPQI